jgi:ketosteroid isomerase-like protein
VRGAGYGVAVTQENVELVKRCLAARGEGTYLDAWALFDPDVTIDLSARPDGRVYHGRREASEAMRAWVERWDDYRYDAEKFFDAGDRVVVFFREHGRGKESGAAAELVGATLWTIRDGKVVHTRTYTDRREALNAVGLRDEDDDARE